MRHSFLRSMSLTTPVHSSTFSIHPLPPLFHLNLRSLQWIQSSIYFKRLNSPFIFSHYHPPTTRPSHQTHFLTHLKQTETFQTLKSDQTRQPFQQPLHFFPFSLMCCCSVESFLRFHHLFDWRLCLLRWKWKGSGSWIACGEGSGVNWWVRWGVCDWFLMERLLWSICEVHLNRWSWSGDGVIVMCSGRKWRGGWSL